MLIFSAWNAEFKEKLLEKVTNVSVQIVLDKLITDSFMQCRILLAIIFQIKIHP